MSSLHAWACRRRAQLAGIERAGLEGRSDLRCCRRARPSATATRRPLGRRAPVPVPLICEVHVGRARAHPHGERCFGLPGARWRRRGEAPSRDARTRCRATDHGMRPSHRCARERRRARPRARRARCRRRCAPASGLAARRRSHGTGVPGAQADRPRRCAGAHQPPRSCDRSLARRALPSALSTRACGSRAGRPGGLPACGAVRPAGCAPGRRCDGVVAAARERRPAIVRGCGRCGVSRRWPESDACRSMRVDVAESTCDDPCVH